MLANPYAGLVGPGWQNLPSAIRRAQSVPLSAFGSLRITGAASRFGRCLAALLRLPKERGEVLARLDVQHRDQKIIWTRTFSESRVSTAQQIRGGRLVESSGPFSLEFSLGTEGERLIYRSTRLRFLGLALPQMIGLQVTGELAVGSDSNSWHVRVCIRHRKMGELYAYEGVMTAE